MFWNTRMRRPAAVLGVLAAAALATGAGVAAGGSPSKPAASADPGVPQAVVAAAHAGLQDLVQRGVIDQAAATAVEQQVRSGSVEPGELIASGVVDEAQMQQVNDVLVRIKRGLAPAG